MMEMIIKIWILQKICAFPNNVENNVNKLKTCIVS